MAMNSIRSANLREMLAQGRLEHAVTGLQRLDVPAAANVLTGMRFAEQEILFRALPVDFAAKLLARLSYYDAYVLMHSRPLEELRSIIDNMDPHDRMQFFDELPEEAWQRVMEEIAAEEPAKGSPEESFPLRKPPTGITAAIAAEPIIEARQIEKYFQQPDGRRIQVIAPIDLRLDGDTIFALLGARFFITAVFEHDRTDCHQVGDVRNAGSLPSLLAVKTGRKMQCQIETSRENRSALEHELLLFGVAWFSHDGLHAR